MTGKLMKYELRSMLRTFLPLWGVLLVVAFLNRFTLQAGSFARALHGVPATLLMVIYVIGIMAIAVVACGGCFLGSNAQAREGLWGWIRDSFEGSQNYSFQSTPIPSGDLPAYTMDVPEEYHYVTDQSIQSAEYAALTYENDAGNILALDYQYETENSSGSLSVFADEEDVQKVTVNGVSADLYVGEDEDSTSIIVWMDPETTALLSVTGDLPADELLALAETVRPVK